jgi:3-oxoacyl-[acyl-carrier-protein] synthase-3
MYSSTDSQPALPPPPTRGVGFRYDQVFVEAWAAEVPSVALTTAQIEDQLRPLYRKLGFKPGWVEAVTGIRERRMWASDLPQHVAAARAAQRALTTAGVDAAEVQALISCSVYKGRLEPSIACEIQGELGIGSHCLNFDVGNACLGFLTGLIQAANMIELGQVDAALVIAAEDSRPVLDATIARLRDPRADIHTFKDNLATLTLGCAATAAVLTSKRRTRGGHRLHGGTTRSAAHHHGLCVGDANGMVTDSVTLLREGVALAGVTWADVSDLLGWARADVRTFAMHQVGKAHHDTVVRQLGVDPGCAPQIYPWMGNIGACGVPTTAILASQQGHYRAGDRLALMGIGSGLNCVMLGMTW